MFLDSRNNFTRHQCEMRDPLWRTCDAGHSCAAVISDDDSDCDDADDVLTYTFLDAFLDAKNSRDDTLQNI